MFDRRMRRSRRHVELACEVGVVWTDAPDPSVEHVVRGLGQRQEGDDERLHVGVQGRGQSVAEQLWMVMP